MLMYSLALSYLQYRDILIFQEIYQRTDYQGIDSKDSQGCLEIPIDPMIIQRCWKLDTRVIQYSKSPDIL